MSHRKSAWWWEIVIVQRAVWILVHRWVSGWWRLHIRAGYVTQFSYATTYNVYIPSCSERETEMNGENLTWTRAENKWRSRTLETPLLGCSLRGMLMLNPQPSGIRIPFHQSFKRWMLLYLLKNTPEWYPHELTHLSSFSYGILLKTKMVFVYADHGLGVNTRGLFSCIRLLAVSVRYYISGMQTKGQKELNANHLLSR